MQIGHKVKSFDFRDDAILASMDYIDANRINSQKVIVLCANSNIVYRAKKLFSKNPRLSAGINFYTAPNYLREVWFFSPIQQREINRLLRLIILNNIIKGLSPEDNERINQMGKLKILDELAKNSLTSVVSAFNVNRKNLGPGQELICHVLAQYEKFLDVNNLFEISQIPYYIFCDDDYIDSASKAMFVFLGYDDKPVYLYDFINNLNAVGSNVIEFAESKHIIDIKKSRIYSESKHQNNQNHEFKIFAPTGPNAVNDLLCSSIEKSINDHNCKKIIVASKDAFTIYKQTRARLCELETFQAVNTTIDLNSISYWKALKALMELRYIFEDLKTFEILYRRSGDFILSRFSGVKSECAMKLISKWKNNRNLNFSDIKSDMIEACSCEVIWQGIKRNKIDLLIELLEKDDILTMSRVLLKSAKLSNEENIITTKISTSIIDAFELMELLKIDYSVCTSAIECLSVGFNFLSNDANMDYEDVEDVPVIEFTSLGSASQRDPLSCDAMFAIDLSTDKYSLKSPDNAVCLLYDNLNIKYDYDNLNKQRHELERICQIAKNYTYIGRQICGQDANDLYSSVILQEFFISLDNLDISELDENNSKLDFNTASETNIFKNLSLVKRKEKKPEAEFLKDFFEDEYIQKFLTEVSVKKFSASAIETYLSCPYRWFAEKILKLDAPGANFGPLEKGSFAHSVMNYFYEGIFDKGFDRVTKDNLEECVNQLNQSFDIALSRQKFLDARNNPYIPLNESEIAQVEKLRNSLINLVKRDASFLPGYKPKYFEYKFGYEQPFMYAGLPICGAIDRIDINNNNNAVIIDYKGSASSSYQISKINLFGEDDKIEIPNKVQTLIYAKVARDLLGLNIVGALYRGYSENSGNGKTPGAAGAYDLCYLSGEDYLDGAKPKNNSIPQSNSTKDSEKYDILNLNFNDLIDQVEKNIELVLAGIKQANISIKPIDDKVCEYCDVLNCGKKG